MEILLQASLYFNIEHIRDLSLTQTTHTRTRAQSPSNSEGEREDAYVHHII